jgi:sodium transport system permease protein
MFSMRWAIVREIFRRELRDQLRDRRTLFMIFALPILLYPMLGIGMAQLSTALEQRPRSVVVVGVDLLPDEPRLLEPSGEKFEAGLFEVPTEAPLYRVRPEPANSDWADPTAQKQWLREGRADVVVIIPRDIKERVADGTKAIRPELAFDSATERSRDTSRAIREIFASWNDQIVGQRLQRDDKPRSYVDAVRPELVDVARVANAGTSVWARLFPFILVLMSLTGAFYPAIDLCAGEKERGTMETLLITPASRPEIVTGKFLTVCLASIASALLNLFSMGLTAWQLTAQMGDRPRAGAAAALGVPSLSSLVWIVVLLLPLSAFFSALCVAMATMARSMKEGQYYLTPLYLAVLPLVFASLAPGIELDLFTSLVPVTGVALLLRSLLQGKYNEAQMFFLPVLVPLIVYGALALRWAVDQFSREDVLFREAERIDPKLWLVHTIRDRGPLPTPGQALLCFTLIITTAWFTIGWMGSSWTGLVTGQAVFILGPPLLMALVLTSSPKATLRLRGSSWTYVLLGLGLALALNPLSAELRQVVQTLFPVPRVHQEQISKMVAPLNLGTALFALALVPAICEELAFRGFILSGLSSYYRREVAIVLSAFLFGFLHVLLSLFQQFFNAGLLGLVLALLALRSGSLLPGLIFHAVNNGLGVWLGTRASEPGGLPTWLYRDPAQALYQPGWVVAGAIASMVMLVALVRSRDHAMIEAMGDEADAEAVGAARA